ncbi:MAG: hypothetical protein FWG44_03040 [Oscillospiraceae bacterium]|nr:hypothetical protein [Oscillospiraceae bacterium]
MKKLKDIKSISALLKNDKAVKMIVAVGFAVIFIILLSDLFSFGSERNASGRTPAPDGKSAPDSGQSIPFDFNVSEYSKQLEEQLCGLISQIQGVGKIKVMVTLESFEAPPVMPKVRGVAVVCDGGGDVFIKQKVVETVSKVLGISTARVCVTY